MIIDWVTVGAQVVNFIILVWLMKRFLYRPVLNAIADRESEIATQLADAAATKKKAHKQQSDFEEKNKTFDQQKDTLLKKATETAAKQAEQIRTEAIQAADELSAARHKAILAETEQLHADIARQMQRQVFDITRRVLKDLADVSIEQQIGEVFIQRLKNIDNTALASFASSLMACNEQTPALVRSTFELPSELQSRIRSVLEERFGQTIALTFTTTPELISGIELSTQEQKLAWSIADYLQNVSLNPLGNSDTPDSKETI